MTPSTATARAVVERIGTLADRLRDRFGREFGRCRTCGKPTRSHRVGDGLQCHTCHVDERPVALPDGGQPDPDGAVPPAKQCSMPDCPNAAVDPTSNAALCREHHPELEDADDQDALDDDQDGADPPASSDTDESGENHTPEGGSPGSNPTPDADESGSSNPGVDEWGAVDFATVEPDTYPPALVKREQWMGRLADEKMPFAPWGDRDHPDADDDADARYKWSLTENYADGETVAMAEPDPRLDGRVFIQQDTDPFAFVDGDDVRDPATGAVHPAFIKLLDALGPTYADVSTSGAGVHAYYRGDLPNDQGQATFEIDTEPWGANDDPPTVEIYANTHVCVTTGDHVDGAPDDVHPWDPDAVETVLDEYDALKDPAPEPDHDTDQDLALDDHDPDATERGERTTDARDIALAVDRLRPRDLPLRTRQVDTDATGWEQWDPSSYRTSQGNDSLHRPPDEPVFHDHKHGESFGVLSLFAAEQGILSKPWDRLAGGDWWDAVDAARDAGAPIPEYDGRRGVDDPDHTAVLPPAVRDLSTATSGWDWQHAGERPADALTVDDARERTVDAIADAYDHGDRVLIEALPTMGKSYGAVKAAAESGEPITILTGRGNKEQYDQFREWADEHGLDVYTLPSFARDCDTANGEHGVDWKQTVMDWYHRGATPQEIHKRAEYHLGEPLPCQRHEGHSCPYASLWDFDPDEYDILLGHYTHAHKSKVTAGRTVVFDEFTEDYEQELGATKRAVSYWLSTADGVPFEDYTDLIEHRDDQERRGEALLWFEDHGVERDESLVFEDPHAHADAPLAVYTLLAGEDLGNGFERATLDDGTVGVYDRESTAVHALRPPNLTYTSGVVALDGTPTKRMWELSLGTRLNHRPVLQDGERAEYIEQALNLNLVRTTEHVKPYNSADHVTPDADAALLEAVADEHGERPGLITSNTAEGEYADAGVLEFVDETRHYGNVLGSNQFTEKRLGAVIGSNHYGDQFIQKWGAYNGVAVERDDGTKGAGLSYGGGFGDDVLRHMREHDTLQAAMRFGRDGNGAVVYIHTDTLPGWVPVAGEARVLKTWSDGMQSVVDALEDLGSATTAEIAAHPAVDVCRRQVFDHLETLRDRGALARHRNPDDGRGVLWRDTGLDDVNDHGAVDLGTDADEFDTPTLDDLEVAEPARIDCIYTWEFLNTPVDAVDDTDQRGESSTRTAGRPSSGGDPPPEPGD